MIKFQALMQAIHQSIHDAARAVEEQGIKHIDDFFELIEADDDEKEQGSSGKNAKTYRPKTYSMEFPSRTPDGIKTVVVEVPLITLSPISSPRISEVKFTTKLEVTSDESDQLYVAFPMSPKQKKQGFFSKPESSSSPDSTNTTIEITLKGDEPPEGLQKLIEGYERALRAQIPG